MRLTAACDTTGAAEVAASQPGTRRYVRVEHHAGEFSATVYDRFPGGCVTSRLRSSSDPKGGFASEAQLLFGFTARQALRQALEERPAGGCI